LFSDFFFFIIFHHLIHFLSIKGIHGNLGQANYATAKSGINGFTKTVAKGLF